MKKTKVILFLILFFFIRIDLAHSQATSNDLKKDLTRRLKGLSAEHLEELFEHLKAPNCEKFLGKWKNVGYASTSELVGSAWDSSMEDVNSPENTTLIIGGQCEDPSSLTAQVVVSGYYAVKDEDHDIPLPLIYKPPTKVTYDKKENFYGFYEPFIWKKKQVDDETTIFVDGPTKMAYGRPERNMALWRECRYLNDTKYNFLLCAYAIASRDNASGHWTVDSGASWAYSLFSDGKLSNVTTQIQSSR